MRQDDDRKRRFPMGDRPELYDGDTLVVHTTFANERGEPVGQNVILRVANVTGELVVRFIDTRPEVLALVNQQG